MSQVQDNFILGISTSIDGASAALVHNGKVVACAPEANFNFDPHAPCLPLAAIRYCLREGSVAAAKLNAVTFVDKPPAANDASSRRIFAAKMRVEKQVDRAIGTLGREGRVLFCDRHMARVAAAFYPSPFDSAAVLLIDGAGQDATTILARGDKATIELFSEMNYPHALGVLNRALAHFCGFDANTGASDMARIACAGAPLHYDTLRRELIDLRPDGSYRMDASLLCNPNLPQLRLRLAPMFGGPARQAGTALTRREMDIAASLAKLSGEVLFKTLCHLRASTPERQLVLAGDPAGGAALGVREIFERTWNCPAPGAVDGAMGAAMLASHLFYRLPRIVGAGGAMSAQ